MTTNRIVAFWTLWMLAALVTCWMLLATLSSSQPVPAREWYVSPTGGASGSGAIGSPWNLQTALSNAKKLIKPGDTVWLRGGVYKGAFISSLIGTSAAPIVVRSYTGEWATLDSGAVSNRSAFALTVNGPDVWFWGFEVTDSYAGRTWSPEAKGTSVWVSAPRSKFINLVVHDGQQGFGFWSAAPDSEIYGTLIYNVGLEGGDRGHGHSIYVQNVSGKKRIAENILFNGFSLGIQAYTEQGKIDNIQMEGNVSFNHGNASRTGGPKVNYYMGGGDDPDNPVMKDNFGYYSPFNSSGRNIDIRGSCVNGTFTGNYMVGGTVSISCIGTTTVTGNLWAGKAIDLANRPGNTISAVKPTGKKIVVRPNKYEPGRAHIIVYNFDLSPTVSVDLSATGLGGGDAFEIRDAQNYFGAPVVTGRYDAAPVSLPMTGLTIATPIGNIPVPQKHTAPEFAVFVVLPTNGSVSPTPPPPPPPPPVPPVPPTVPPTPPPPPPPVPVPVPPVTPPVPPVLPAPPTSSGLPTSQLGTSKYPTLAGFSRYGTFNATVGQRVELYVFGFDYDSTIRRVEIYVNGVLFQGVDRDRLTAFWTAPAPGNYTFKAVAYGSDGAIGVTPDLPSTRLIWNVK